MSHAFFEKSILFTYLLFIAGLFYQGWNNIVMNRLTNFSLDAIMLLYVQIVNGKKAREKAEKLLHRDRKKIKTLGVYAICLGFAFIFYAIKWYINM